MSFITLQPRILNPPLHPRRRAKRRSGGRESLSNIKACIAQSQYGTMLLLGMRVVALATLKALLEAKPVHTAAREPVMAWYRQVKAADWANPANVKRDVRSISILKDGRAVFNIAGNKYRIVVWINYPYRVVYIRFIGTHRMYDAIDAQSI